MKKNNGIGILAVSGLLVTILVLPTLIVVPFTNSGSMERVEETAHKEQVTTLEDAPFSVKVWRSSSEQVEDVPLETYVARVVASEMPVNFEVEALKAQALAARTYITQHIVQGEKVSGEADVTDTVTHQVYKDENELRSLWKENFTENMAKINEAVTATKGEIITYDHKPITASFFSTSNGYTENAGDYWGQDIPYLKSVESPWDQESPKFADQKIVTVAEVEQTLGISLGSMIEDTTMTKTEGNRVDEVHIADHTFTGREIREKFGLSSSDFSIQQKGDHVIFTTKGYGHGVGMSQYGANGMAKTGKGYKDIIAHYYQNTEISPLSTQTAALSPGENKPVN
ncbi:stage II sporulation protein D [Halobacillus litoralis]|uniref:stage II sporulation protein D n=1 Tax=Halobacillus litoralis TaxID=45668 RepID=UPI001CFC8AA9|nr:stage II sporulation protein D [Halobacillus litoralis]